MVSDVQPQQSKGLGLGLTLNRDSFDDSCFAFVDEQSKRAARGRLLAGGLLLASKHIGLTRRVRDIVTAVELRESSPRSALQRFRQRDMYRLDGRHRPQLHDGSLLSLL